MCDLELTNDRLIAADTKGNVDEVHRLRQQLEALRRLKGFRADSALGSFVDQAITTAEKCMTILSETSLDSGTWKGLADDLIALSQECILRPSAVDLTEELSERLTRMAFETEEITEQQSQAVAEGDMKLTEVLYFKKVSIQESMVQTFNALFNILDEHHIDGFLQPTKKLHEVHNRANANVSAIMKEQEGLKRKLQHDLKNLDEHQGRVKAEHHSRVQEYQKYMQDVTKRLELNQTHHDQILAAIEELERRLVVLGEERCALVSQQLDVVDAEKRRVCDYNNFNAFVQRQRLLLTQTLHNAEAAEEVTDLYDETLCLGCNSVEQFLKETEASIEAVRMQTHETRLKHFRSLYLTLGDLQYKKERNLEELDKKIAQTHIQQELAMETFNPKAKEYSQVKKELIKVREEMEAQLNVIAEKATLHIEAFKPTEVALIQAGKSFVHPVEELERMNRSREQKLLEYHKLMNSQEKEGEPDLEMRAIEEARQAMHPRKPRSSGGQGPSSGGSAGGKRLGSDYSGGGESLSPSGDAHRKL
jgi:hypothetical protein